MSDPNLYVQRQAGGPNHLNSPDSRRTDRLQNATDFALEQLMGRGNQTQGIYHSPVQTARSPVGPGIGEILNVYA
ncbi:MAG: hypothetical protein SFU25_04630 [Candidatus Caenarcaniphilales bacterium]|nr:hypothetical protein [Candidatus Caenarcaniphilales bacterium]